ncbi:acyl carrier protein [Cupriavidus basilensis]|uniref:acyl carrier protein n=1 Tax=Cupriavidus basilensis TaxID=68895 RepID=UPI0023E8776B|nr:acyl carrier protein [Cupriavidus basilensis]MDF3887827.1 acyl carrier protein [Cupriavidus basilensis]
MSQFYEGLAEIFEVGVEEIGPSLNLEEKNWDSLAIVSTIALVDECFNVMLDGQSLGSCIVVADIEKLIQDKKKD